MDMTRGFEVAPEISSPLGVNTVLQQRNPSRVICLIEFVRLPISVGAYPKLCLTILSTLNPVNQNSNCSNTPRFQ